MKRLLFSVTYYYPYSSGLSLYVKRLAETLARSGYRVSVASYQHHKSLKQEEIINGVSVYRAKPLMAVNKGFISLDWLMVNLRLVRKQDVIVVNLPQLEGIIPVVLGKISGKKIISVYHCEVVLPGGLINSLAQSILTISNYLTLLLSDKIITYTKDFAKNSKLLTRFNKIDYIYPITNQPRIDKRVQGLIKNKIISHPGNPPAGGTSRTRRELRTRRESVDNSSTRNDQPFIIGVAARLAAEKGIEYLFEAIPEIESRIKNYELRKKDKRKNVLKTPGKRSRDSFRMGRSKETFKIVIAGSLSPVGEENYKKRIIKLVERYKEYVIFLGELKEEEMGSFYSLLDILVLPSVNSTEAFGMVQVEAMMMGVPVVATDLPGVRIPIEKTGMGILAPIKNSQKLTSAIVEVLHHRNKYIKGLKSIEKEFSSDRTINFYKELLS